MKQLEIDFHAKGRDERGRLLPGKRAQSAHTHGMSHSPEYNAWHSMKARCANPHHADFANYGGRGISVCQRWMVSFEAFYADMGPRPAGRSLDRIDNDWNYEPSNCRWATWAEQGANRRIPRGDNHPARLHPERLPRGEQHGCAKLTELQVKEIREVYGDGSGVKCSAIALQYGISRRTVRNIAARKVWKHVA